MAMSETTKQGALLASAVVLVVGSIVGGVVVGVVSEDQTVRSCIEQGRVWTESSCVDKVEDARYIDD